MDRRYRHYLEFLGVRLVQSAVCVLPLRPALALGSSLGWLAFRLLGIRRETALANLQRAFGTDMTARQREAIASSAYRNLGMAFVDYARFACSDHHRVLELVTFEGLEHLDRALHDGKGAVLLAGHFGSWELMGAALRARGYPLSYLVGEQHNRLVDDLMNRLRSRMGIQLIPMGMSVRGVLRALRHNEFVALLSDQDAGSGGVFVGFFDTPASTPQGPALFALKTGAPIIAGFAIRTRDGRHRIVLEKPISFAPTGDQEEDIARYTQAYTSMLESYVRRYPDHWFWPHRRWKTRPGLLAGSKGNP